MLGSASGVHSGFVGSRHLLDVVGEAAPNCIQISRVLGQGLVFFSLAYRAGGIGERAEKLIDHVKVVVELESAGDAAAGELEPFCSVAELSVAREVVRFCST